MALAPIEVLVISFPGNQFSGGIIPEIERLVGNDTITIIDGLLVTKDADGEVTLTEFEELGADNDAAALADLMNQLDSLISDDDVATLAEMQAQMEAMKAQQAPPPPPPAPAAAAPAGDDLMTQLSKLADLKAAGVLDDAEFAAAKAKLLGT